MSLMIESLITHRRISQVQAAPIVGEDVNLLRQWMHKLKIEEDLGRGRQGGESGLHVGGVTALALLRETKPISRSRGEAWARARSLLGAMSPYAAEEFFPADLYAILAWDFRGDSTHYLCRGHAELVGCIAALAAE